jgi:hypothetical protein
MTDMAPLVAHAQIDVDQLRARLRKCGKNLGPTGLSIVVIPAVPTIGLLGPFSTAHTV